MRLLLSGPLLFVMGFVPPAHAASPIVRLQAPADLSTGVAAMPMITGPLNHAERLINVALARLDAQVRQAIAACKEGDGGPASWRRTVDTTMHGPGYLSFLIKDDAFCGGAHPSVSTMSIVYDLGTGVPVDWTRLLPRSLTGRLALQTGMDGTRTVTLASPRLQALYSAGYNAPDGTAEDRAACKSEMQDTANEGPAAMMAWLDAKRGGLALQHEAAHAVQACATPVIISIATLRAEGARPALLTAIKSAQAAP